MCGPILRPPDGKHLVSLGFDHLMMLWTRDRQRLGIAPAAGSELGGDSQMDASQDQTGRRILVGSTLTDSNRLSVPTWCGSSGAGSNDDGAGSDDAGGCGCRVPETDRPKGLAILAALAVGRLLRRRRRRAA